MSLPSRGAFTQVEKAGNVQKDKLIVMCDMTE